jgi:hypothetical protein
LSVNDHIGSEVAAWADWTGDFFDDEFQTTFDMLGGHRYGAAEVGTLVSPFNLPAGARILDVPSGFGRHAGPLQRSYRLTGGDKSADIAWTEFALRRAPDVAFDNRSPFAAGAVGRGLSG